MKMLIFPHRSSFFIISISIVSLQFAGCQGIYNFPPHPLYYLTLFHQVRQTKVPGAAGVHGPETDPVSQAVVLAKTPRPQTMSALVAQLVGTISKEKIFHFILIRKLSTLEPLGSLSSHLSATLLTDPDQSVFGDLPGR